MALQLIIPTLWQPPDLLASLEAYLDSPVVERLILIDNAPQHRPSGAAESLQHPKLLCLPQAENLYVNRAWNLGMQQIEAPQSLVGILNDDIQIPEQVLAALLDAWADPAIADGTVVGLLPPPEPFTAFALQPFPYLPHCSIGAQCRGFGSALFLERQSFEPIPEALRIWYGDDWILRQAAQVLGLSSSLIARQHHLTMQHLRGSEAFRALLAQDRRQAAALLGFAS